MATTFGLYYAGITCGRFHAERFGRLRVSFYLKSYSAPTVSSIGILQTPPRFFQSDVVSPIARFLDLQLTDLSTGSGGKHPKLHYEITQIIILCNILLHGLVFCCNDRLFQRAQ